MASSGNAWNDGLTRRRFLKRSGAATAATFIAWHGLSLDAKASIPKPAFSNRITIKVCVEITVDTPIPEAEPEGGWQKWLENLLKAGPGGNPPKKAQKRTTETAEDDGGWMDLEEGDVKFERSRVAPDGLPTLKLIDGVPHVPAGTKLCLILKKRRPGR